MADLTQMSDEELLKAYSQAQAPTSTPAAVPDLSSMSDQELLDAYNGKTKKAEPPGWLDELKHVGGMAGRVATSAIAGLPLMAEDAGVAARNLWSGATGGRYDEYELPSESFRRAQDQLFGTPRNLIEQGTDIVGPILAGGGASRIPRLPAAFADALSASPSEIGGGAAQAPKDFVTPAEAKRQALAQKIKDYQDQGFVIPPVSGNDTFMNRRLEGWAGKIATQQEAAVHNQQTANRIAAEANGLNTDAPLTPGALQAIQEEAWEDYRKIRALGPIKPDDQYRAEVLAVKNAVGNVERNFPGSKPSPVTREAKSLIDTPPGGGGTNVPPVRVPGETPYVIPGGSAGGPSNIDPLTLTPKAEAPSGAPVKVAPVSSPAQLADGLTALGNGRVAGETMIPGGSTGGASNLDPLTLTPRPALPSGAATPVAPVQSTGSGPFSGLANEPKPAGPYTIPGGRIGGNSRLDPLTLTEVPRTIDTSAAIDKIRLLRDASKSAYLNGESALGGHYKALSNALENLIDRNAKTMSENGSVDPDVVAKYRAARQRIAIAKTTEEAMNPGSDNIDIRKLSSAVDKGEIPPYSPLYGIGKFGSSFKLAASAPEGKGSPGVEHLSHLLGPAMGAITGVEHGAGPGFAAGTAVSFGLPLSRDLTRRYLLGTASGQERAIPGLDANGYTARRAADIARILSQVNLAREP